MELVTNSGMRKGEVGNANGQALRRNSHCGP